jgi:hypothetical protein
LDRQAELVTRPDGRTIDPVYEATSGWLDRLEFDLDVTATPGVRGALDYTYSSATGQLLSVEAQRHDGTAFVADGEAGSIADGFDGFLPTSETWSGGVKSLRPSSAF